MLQEVRGDRAKEDDVGDLLASSDEELVDAMVSAHVRIRQLAQARPCSVDLLGLLGRHPRTPHHDGRIVVGLGLRLLRALRHCDERRHAIGGRGAEAVVRSVVGVGEQRPGKFDSVW